MLTVEEIHTYYGDSYVLQGVSLAVAQGQVLALLGRNGMGKTTLIRSTIGFTPPRRGRILFNEKEITGLPPFRAVEMGMAVVPQGRRIFPSLSVRENLTVAARGNGKKGWNLERVFALFPRLKERVGHPGNKLSGGEQQMLAIGRALMSRPKLIMFDEPSLGLSPKASQGIFQTLGKLNQDGLTTLLISQDVLQSLGLAQRAYVLENSRIVMEGKAADLLQDPKVKKAYLGI
jgi:branched-chain amino acid transport system ATP-binding protein